MKCKAVLVFLSTLAVFTGYLLFIPMPPGTKDVFRVWVVNTPGTIQNLVIKVQEYLGYGSFAENIHTWKRFMNGEPEQPLTTFDDVEVFTDTIDGVHVIVYRPLPKKEKAAAIIYIHGGGWVVDLPGVYHKQCYELAKSTGTVVFSVKYRLSPDYPFPGPVEDCLKVTRFVLNYGDRYDVDVRRVGVMGDSAGGNLAAVVALALARENSGLPSLRFQVLMVPGLQALNLKTSSYVDNNLPGLSTMRMADFFGLYFGLSGPDLNDHINSIAENRHIPPELQDSEYAEYVHNKFLPKPKKTASKFIGKFDASVYNKIKDILVNPLFSPLMARDLSNLPPALICYAQFDVLRDDSLHYDRRLTDAGVKVQMHMMEDGVHGDFLFIIPESLRFQGFDKLWTEIKLFVQEQIN